MSELVFDNEDIKQMEFDGICLKCGFEIISDKPNPNFCWDCIEEIEQDDNIDFDDYL